VRIVVFAALVLERLGLEALFTKARNCQVVGSANSAAEAEEEVRVKRPDVVVIDADALTDSVAALCQRLIAAEPATRLIVVAPPSEPSLAVDAIHAGARGFVLREPDAQPLVDAVESVARGGTYISPEVTALLSEWLRTGQPPVDLIDRLSAQEQRIVLLIAEGLTNRAIAAQLKLSEFTVKTYVSSALHKLGLKTRVQVAAAIAQRQLRRD
jgi:two-component system, NarL family, response regulator DevR